MIYFIQEGKDGAIKIGYSSDPETRLRSMQTGNSSRLYLRKVFEGGRQAEAEVHERLDGLRIRDDGEWFEPASEVFDRLDFLDNCVPIDDVIPQAYDGPMRTQVHVPGNERMYAYLEVEQLGRYYGVKWSDYTIDGLGYPRDRLFSKRVRATGMTEDIHHWWKAHEVQFRHDARSLYGGATGCATGISGQSIPTLRKIILYHWRVAVADGLPSPPKVFPSSRGWGWIEMQDDAIEEYASEHRHSGVIDAIRDYHDSKRQKYECT